MERRQRCFVEMIAVSNINLRRLNPPQFACATVPSSHVQLAGGFRGALQKAAF